jgi:hypothetical protein
LSDGLRRGKFVQLAVKLYKYIERHAATCRYFASFVQQVSLVPTLVPTGGLRAAQRAPTALI